MDFNSLADDLANSFGTPKGNDTPSDDHSSIASELAKDFGSPNKHESIKKSGRIYISPQPPISGFTPEESDVLNQRTPIQGTAQNAPSEPFPYRPDVFIPNIGRDIGQNFMSGIQGASEGLGDIVNRGELKQGAKKLGLGALGAVTSIPAGISQGGFTEPITQLTGNPDIGSRAGFIAGSALPIVPGAGVISKMRPSNIALKDLTDIITNDGANPENLVHVVQEMKSNPRLAPADLNPALLSTTQKLFTTEGDAAKNYLASTSTNRVASSAGAVNSAYDTALGLPVNAVNKLRDLANASKAVGEKEINPAVKGAGPVDTTNTVAAIDSILKPGVMSKISGESGLPLTAVKKELANIKQHLTTGGEVRTGAEDLHDFQKGLRRTAESLLNSADGGSRELGNALMNVRNNLVNDIDKASPQVNGKGTYKPALSNYRDEKEIAEAFHDAYNGVLTNSKKLENRPEFTKEWFDSLTPFEKQAAIEGIRTRIDTEIGVAKNPALAGTGLGRSAFNQKKIEAVLGKEETDKLLKTLEDERKISNTHNKLIEGSQTAMRMSGESKVALTPPKEAPDALHRLSTLASYVAPELANYYGTGYAIPGIGLATSLAATAGHKVATAASNKITRALELERNAQLAKMALPTQGPARDELIRSLEAAIPGPKQSIVRRSLSAASRLPVIPP